LSIEEMWKRVFKESFGEQRIKDLRKRIQRYEGLIDSSIKLLERKRKLRRNQFILGHLCFLIDMIEESQKAIKLVRELENARKNREINF